MSCWPKKHHDVIKMASKLKITNFRFMTSWNLCKFDPISINIDRFSPKFQYDVAEDVLLYRSCFYFSFWWMHHALNLRFLRVCHFFSFCVYSLWEMTFFQNWILHCRLSWAIPPLFLLNFPQTFDTLYPRKFSITYVTVFQIKCWDHINILTAKWDLRISLSVYVLSL